MIRFLVAFVLFCTNGDLGRRVPARLRSRRPRHRRFPGRAALRSAPAWPRPATEAEAGGMHAPFSGEAPLKYPGPATLATPDARGGQFHGAPSSGDRARRWCDASRPRPEAAGGIEAGVRAMDTPEGFNGEVFGGRRIADDSNNPAVNL